MIGKENYMDIKSLIRQGYSQRAIARMTGVHRKTVKRYMEEGVLPTYRGKSREDKIESYKPLIHYWLKQENYQSTKIFELLLLQGFEGSYSTVNRFVRTLKEERSRVAYVRFETMPGQQAQVDFGDFQVTEADGSKTTIYCFIMVLGYSRHMYIEFIPACTMSHFLECHQNAFGFFGGIPIEILYDNMKNVVIKRLVGKIQWNKTFEAFAMHYGFKPLVTPPYSPWAKGKVERPIRYVRERFWRGYVYNTLRQSNKDILSWIHRVASERVHGTTKEKVSLRFDREKQHLACLPRSPYDISEQAYRKVYKDCQISFSGNFYVVPHKYVGQKVLLRIKDRIIRIFHDDQMIAVYQIPQGKGQTLAEPRFYKELKEDPDQIKRKYQKPFSKAKATRGLLSQGYSIKVMRHNLLTYDALIEGSISCLS